MKNKPGTQKPEEIKRVEESKDFSKESIWVDYPVMFRSILLEKGWESADSGYLVCPLVNKLDLATQEKFSSELQEEKWVYFSQLNLSWREYELTENVQGLQGTLVGVIDLKKANSLVSYPTLSSAEKSNKVSSEAVLNQKEFVQLLKIESYLQDGDSLPKNLTPGMALVLAGRLSLGVKLTRNIPKEFLFSNLPKEAKQLLQEIRVRVDQVDNAVAQIGELLYQVHQRQKKDVNLTTNRLVH